MRREVLSEILDELDPSDPRALRSRRDPRLINGFMRGQAWIQRELRRMPAVGKVVEIGAGSGELIGKIARQGLGATCLGVDYIPCPSFLNRDQWRQGDVMELEEEFEDAVVVANLFLHHFNDLDLQGLGHRLRKARAVLCVEPYRSVFSMALGGMITPIVNDVTRHDMRVSIRAGFRKGEIPERLGSAFEWHECSKSLGGIRVKGVRK